MATEYTSPVDGARLLTVTRDGETVYRDASTGTEYSEDYAKENFEKAKAPKKAAAKTEDKKEDKKSQILGELILAILIRSRSMIWRSQIRTQLNPRLYS